PKVKAWFEETATSVKDKVGEIDWKAVWDRVRTALIDVAGTVGDFASKAWEKTKAWFTAAATEVGNKVSSIDWKAVWDKVKTALVDAVSKVSDAATAIGEKIGQWFEDAKIKVQETITGMDMTGISAGTRDRITQVMAAEKIENIGQAISDWIVNGGVWLENNLTPVLNQFATTVTAIAVQLQNEQGKENSPVSKAFGNAFVAVLKASWSVLSSAVLWEAFWNVFLAQLALTETIKQRIRDKVLEIGHNIVEGIVSGIEAKVDELVTSIEDTVNKIPEIAKKLLGIASPSRVMIEIGNEVMAGLTIGIEAGSDDALEAILNATDRIVEFVRGMVDAINAMTANPDTSNLARWGAAISDTLNMVVKALIGLYDLPGGEFGENADAINLAKNIAKELGEVVAFISDSAEALLSLGELDLAKVGMEKISGFVAFVHEILNQIVAEAAKWGPTEEAIKTLFGPARKIVDQILDIVRIVEPAATAMTALAEATVEDMQTAAYKWSWVITAVLVICNNLAAIAATLDISGYPAAATAAEAINKIIVLIEPAVSAITALAGAVLDEIDKAAYKWSWIITGVLVVCNNLAAIATNLDQSGYPAAEKFAESAGRILTVVKTAVESIAQISEFELVVDLPARLTAFGRNVAELSVALVSMVEWVMNAFRTGTPYYLTAEEVYKKFEDVAKFSDAVQKGVGFIKPVMDAIAGLGGFVASADIATRARDFGANVADLMVSLMILVEGVMNAFREGTPYYLTPEEVYAKFEEAGKFSDAVQKGVGFIKPVIDAIASVADYKAVSGLPTKILNFAQDLDTILMGILAIADRWVLALEDGTLDTAKLAKMAAFSANVQTAIGVIKPGIDNILALEKLPKNTNVEKEWGVFEEAVKFIVGKVESLAIDLGDTATTSAAEFQAVASSIYDAVKAGLSTIALIGGESDANTAHGVLDDFAEAVADSMGDAVEAVKQGLKDIIAAFSDRQSALYQAAYTAGKAIGNGIMAGMRAAMNVGTPTAAPTVTTNNTNTYNITQTGAAQSPNSLRATVTALQMAGTA
ncbi:MAG: hypothetical protein WC565_04690, partial [Parcubacteria group bacterium]